MKVKCIPNVYGSTKDRKILDAIEQARGKNEDGSLKNWWICGQTFCTQLTNGYYHVYCLEKTAFYSVILRDYRVSRDGKLTDTNKFYSVPTREDIINWCDERDLHI